jgi:hypothetical protein
MSKLLLSRWREESGLEAPTGIKTEEWAVPAGPRPGETPLAALARTLSSNAEAPDRCARAPPPPALPRIWRLSASRALAPPGGFWARAHMPRLTAPLPTHRWSVTAPDSRAPAALQAYRARR